MSWRSLISREERFARCRNGLQKQRILYYNLQGFKAPTIAKLLQEEGTIAQRPSSGPPSTITPEVKRIVEEQMRSDDETTAVQLHAHLNSLGYSVSCHYFEV